MKAKDRKIPQSVVKQLNRDLATFFPEEIILPKKIKQAKVSTGGRKIRSEQISSPFMMTADLSIVPPIANNQFLTMAEDNTNPPGFIRKFWNSLKNQRDALVEGAINMKNAYVNHPHIAMTGFPVEFGAKIPSLTLNFEFKYPHHEAS